MFDRPAAVDAERSLKFEKYGQQMEILRGCCAPVPFPVLFSPGPFARSLCIEAEEAPDPQPVASMVRLMSVCAHGTQDCNQQSSRATAIPEPNDGIRIDCDNGLSLSRNDIRPHNELETMPLLACPRSLSLLVRRLEVDKLEDLIAVDMSKRTGLSAEPTKESLPLLPLP